jgi:hypothetical protein
VSNAARPRTFSPSAYARRRGLSHGVFGGSRFWLLAGGLVWSVRTTRRIFGHHATVVATEILKPGQFVVIEAIRPMRRRERRASKKAR